MDVWEWVSRLSNRHQQLLHACIRWEILHAHCNYLVHALGAGGGEDKKESKGVFESIKDGVKGLTDGGGGGGGGGGGLKQNLKDLTGGPKSEGVAGLSGGPTSQGVSGLSGGKTGGFRDLVGGATGDAEDVGLGDATGKPS